VHTPNEFYEFTRKMAVIFIIAGIAIVFAILGTSATGGLCVKHNRGRRDRASDDIPRKISNCPYDQGQEISITYKSGQPNIESHRPAQG
jgi:hypothetical protein